jgi:nucleoside permease NupC
MDDASRLQGLVGVAAILGLAWVLSEHRRSISPRMVIGGLALQVGLGVAWVTSRVLGSSGAETMNAAASIFLGQTEAPLTIRPYLARLTRSELLVVMVSGMGLVSGGMLAAYIGFIGGGDEGLREIASRSLLAAILMTLPATGRSRGKPIDSDVRRIVR